MDLDITYFIQLLLILLTLVSLSQILLKPMLAVLVERERLTSSAMENVEEFRKEGDQAKEKYQSAMRQARALGAEKLDAQRQRAKSKEKELISSAQQDAKSFLDTERAKIESSVADAQSKLSADIDSLSEAVVDKVLGEAQS